MTKPQIFITRNDFPIPPATMSFLKERFNVSIWPGDKALTKENFIENLKGKFGVLCYPADKIDREVLDAVGSSLKVVSTYSVGYDHLDLKELKVRGIKVGYTPGILTEATAEHAVAILLAASRRVLESYNLILQKNWTAANWSPVWLCGQGLDGSTVGIVGLGRIGLSIAKKLRPFNIKRLLYYSRSKKPEADEVGGELATIDELVKESDFIVVVVTFNEQTKGIISRERINSMKPNAILVNIARGGLIDQDALIEALQKKKIAGAGLDVTTPEPLPFDSPLLKLDNVVITPHIGSAAIKCRIAMAELACNNIFAVLNGEKMPSQLC